MNPSALVNDAIVVRWLAVFDLALQTRRIRFVSRFATDYGIERQRIYRLRKDHARYTLEPYMIKALCDACGASADYIINGRGSIFSR